MKMEKIIMRLYRFVSLEVIATDYTLKRFFAQSGQLSTRIGHTISGVDRPDVPLRITDDFALARLDIISVSAPTGGFYAHVEPSMDFIWLLLGLFMKWWIICYCQCTVSRFFPPASRADFESANWSFYEAVISELILFCRRLITLLSIN